MTTPILRLNATAIFFAKSRLGVTSENPKGPVGGATNSTVVKWEKSQKYYLVTKGQEFTKWRN